MSVLQSGWLRHDAGFEEDVPHSLCRKSISSRMSAVSPGPDQFVFLLNKVRSVFPFQTPHRKVAFCEPLKIMDEEDIHRHSSDRTGDRDQFSDRLIAHFHPKP